MYECLKIIKLKITKFVFYKLSLRFRKLTEDVITSGTGDLPGSLSIITLTVTKRTEGISIGTASGDPAPA